MKFLFYVFAFFFFVQTNVFSKTRSFTLVNHENEGVKQWLPGTLIVKAQDDVEITLINNVPSGVHGFYLPDFNIREQIKKGEKKTIKFKATKEGLFPMKCHLHATHVGGQLLVLP